jgi:centromeric protein E
MIAILFNASLDSVYDVETTTEEIYESSASGLIEAALFGMNATIFAYGQTSSGKTFTMQGTSGHPGIIPLAMQHIFDMIQESQDKEFLLRVSYLEIYNEIITDLFNTENRNLKIHETAEKGIFVGGATEIVVSSCEHVCQLMQAGEGWFLSFYSTLKYVVAREAHDWPNEHE